MTPVATPFLDLLPRPTLRQSLADGHLSPIDATRARSLLGGIDAGCTAADARRVLVILLARARAYYGVIDYTGPGYVFGRVDSEYPEAFSSRAHWDPANRQWFYPKLCVAHPTIGPGIIFEQAAAMCLPTALTVAAWELAAVVPEAAWTLKHAVPSAYAYVSGHLLPGRWEHCRRRIGTPKMRDRLARALQDLQAHVVALSSAHLAAVYTLGEYEREKGRLQEQAKRCGRPLCVSMPAAKSPALAA